MGQVDFRDNIDPYILDICVDGKLVGYLRWHSGIYTIIMWEIGVDIPIDDLTRKVKELRQKSHRKQA
jgi:hypothetical protein